MFSCAYMFHSENEHWRPCRPRWNVLTDMAGKFLLIPSRHPIAAATAVSAVAWGIPFRNENLRASARGLSLFAVDSAAPLRGAVGHASVQALRGKKVTERFSFKDFYSIVLVHIELDALGRQSRFEPGCVRWRPQACGGSVSCQWVLGSDAVPRPEQSWY